MSTVAAEMKPSPRGELDVAVMGRGHAWHATHEPLVGSSLFISTIEKRQGHVDYG